MCNLGAISPKRGEYLSSLSSSSPARWSQTFSFWIGRVGSQSKDGVSTSPRRQRAASKDDSTCWRFGNDPTSRSKEESSSRIPTAVSLHTSTYRRYCKVDKLFRMLAACTESREIWKSWSLVSVEARSSKSSRRYHTLSGTQELEDALYLIVFSAVFCMNHSGNAVALYVREYFGK